MQNGIECYSLGQKSAWLEQIAIWHHAQWGYLRPTESLQEVKTLYQAHLYADQLPVTHLLFSNTTLIGMFSLLLNTYPFFEDASIPVLNYLLIAKPYRGKGFFKQLMEYVNKAAYQRGFKKIYGFTIDPRLNRLYERLDCHYLGESIFLARKICLFQKIITSC